MTRLLHARPGERNVIDEALLDYLAAAGERLQLHHWQFSSSHLDGILYRDQVARQFMEKAGFPEYLTHYQSLRLAALVQRRMKTRAEQ